MSALALALLVASAPGSPAAHVGPAAVVVDEQGIARVDAQGTRAVVDHVSALTGELRSLALRLEPGARVADVRAVVEAYVAAGADARARAALAEVLGPPGPAPCAADVSGACALVRVRALPSGVLVEGKVGATDDGRRCAPPRVRPMLAGRSDTTLRTYAQVKRSAPWDEIAVVFAEAFAGGGTRVCRSILLDEVAPEVTMQQWRALEDAVRAAGYEGTLRPAWARELADYAPLAKSVVPGLPPSSSPPPGDDDKKAGDHKPWWSCFGLCG